MTPDPVPRFLAGKVRSAWQQLLSPQPPIVVDQAKLAGAPEPVRRWVAHTIGTSAMAPRAVRLVMHGEIKLGRWQPFSAHEALTAGGFIWAATAGRFPLRINGFDRYTTQTGQMRWKMFGVVPVMRAAGPDITRSAAGRLAGETMVLPGGALADHVSWQPVDDHHATASVTHGRHTHQVTVQIDPDGALRAVTLPRWGNPDKGPFADHLFGVSLSEERSFGGYLIPTRWEGGWWYGTDQWADGQFFRATIDQATIM